MFAGVLLHLLLLQTPTPIDREVTFRCPATRAVRLLPLLTKQTGIAFECDAKVRNEVLIVDVKDVKLRELMDRLADAASAKWVLDSRRYRLERPSELEAELRAKEIDRLAGLMKTQIDKKLNELEGRDRNRKYQFADQARAIMALLPLVLRNSDRDDDLSKLTEAFNEYKKASQEGPPSPSELLLFRTLSQLNLKQIAGIAPGGRLVFSTRPNAMQRNLAFKVAHVQQYERSCAEIAPTLSGLKGDDSLVAQNIGNWPRSIQGPIDKCLIMVDRHSIESEIQLELRLINPSGQIIEANTVHISWAGDVPPSKNLKAIPKVQWSPDSLELIADSERAYDAESKLSKEFRNRLYQPEAYDPLSTIVSDLLFSLADVKRKNLVGCIPDSAMCFNEKAKRNLPVDEFEVGLGSQGHLVLDLVEHWVTVKPMFPIAAANQRIDREALAACLRAYRSQGYLQLSDKLRLARSSNDSAGSLLSFFRDYIRDYEFDNELESEQDLDWQFIRFAARLTPTQWMQLKNGGLLPIRSLLPNQRFILDQLLFSCGYSFGASNDDAHNAIEPTEALPNGIPPAAYVVLTLESRYFAFQKLGSPPSELTYIQEFAEDLAEGSNKLMAKRFYLGYSTDYQLGFVFSDDLSTSGSFTDTFYNQTMRPILPSQFPWEYRQAILKEVEEYVQEKTKERTKQP